MLLPTTSMNAWCDRKPVTAANIERSIGVPFSFRGGLRLDVADRRERDVLTADDEPGPVGGHVDAGDDTRCGVAVVSVLFSDGNGRRTGGQLESRRVVGVPERKRDSPCRPTARRSHDAFERTRGKR